MTREELDRLYPFAREELAKPILERDGSKLPPIEARLVEEVRLQKSGNIPKKGA